MSNKARWIDGVCSDFSLWRMLELGDEALNLKHSKDGEYEKKDHPCILLSSVELKREEGRLDLAVAINGPCYPSRIVV